MSTPLPPLSSDGPLDFYHYPQPHSRTFDAQLAAWVRSFDPTRDNGECSDGNPRSSEAWFYHNNFEVPADGSSPLGTYFGVLRQYDRVVVMATLVEDDRGMRAKYNVPGDLMWGLVITYPEYRQEGHGTRMCRFIDGLTAERVKETGQSETHVLFTGYGPAVKIYTRLGYKFIRQVEIDDWHRQAEPDGSGHFACERAGLRAGQALAWIMHPKR